MIDPRLGKQAQRKPGCMIGPEAKCFHSRRSGHHRIDHPRYVSTKGSRLSIAFEFVRLSC